MKKRQLSKKQILASTSVKTSQTKISSFFTKIPKPEASNNKVATDTSFLCQVSSDKKRKQTDDPSELCVIVKKKCSDNIKGLYNSNTITEHYAKTENVKSNENSVLSVAKNLDDTCNDLKQNKALDTNAIIQKASETDTNVTIRTEHNISTEFKSVSTASTQISDIASDDNHSLKENQDLNIASKCLPSARVFNEKSELHDLQVELFDESVIINGNEFDDFFNQEWHAQIDFSTLQRCKVINVKQEPRVVILSVQHIESESVDAVACSGFWRDMQVKIDDIVMIQATKTLHKWVVDNNNGFVITQPDLLISSTTIMSGLFCNRRAVLAEKFRKIELLPDLNADYTIMTVGSLIHQWMQKALRENVHTLSGVIKLMDDMLGSKDTIEYLYTSELSLKDCRKRMMEYAPRIFEFIQHYIRDNKQQRISDLKDNFQGSISEIQDIEENIHIPQLGIKGRIDVTVKVNIHSKRKIMPLEIKTGRSSYSFEHKGQVILYLMMMGFKDQDVDTGLLLYLKENSMKEIKSSHNEKRDLILLRNRLAHYFAKKPEDFWRVNSESDLEMMKLPEPINHHACAKCPYQTICCAYLTKDSNAKLSPSHPLTTLMKDLLSYCESSHLDYVIKWIALLQLEELYENSNSSMSNFWTMSPEKRETKGTCICGLKIIGKVIEKDDRYQHTFARSNIKGETIENCALGSTLAENDYVCVSTDEQINISVGHIFHISHDTVAVLLDKNLTRQQDARSTFHIDKYPSTSLSTFNYASVAGLLGNNEICVKLRRIVIDKKPASFAEKVSRSIVSASAEIISDLNDNQQRAVLKAVTANEYVLIKGMPGTGKTQTLVALIELLQTLRSSVLITAHTHSAVDNILLKLLEKNIDFVRLGSSKKIHPLLTCKSEEYAIASCDSPESLEAFYNSKLIVGVTCYGAYHALIRKRVFDVCVVDESAQIMQPTVLRPLYSARKFILVGDPDQLPPVVKSKSAIKLGADESLFVRLDSDNNTVSLWKQYRMNGRIMRLANDVTYQGKLVTGSKQVENATLTASNIEQTLASCEKWIGRTLSRDLNNSVVVLNTGGTYKLSETSNVKDVTSDQMCANIWEAAVTLRLVQVLDEAGVSARSIGIIAPYNAHKNLLRRIIDKEIEVNTVDQYQGRDKDVILYSCARSVECENTKKEHEILDDKRRLTVAITRARHKLIIIGDKNTLLRYAPFKDLFNVIDEKNVINLYDGEEDFSWKSLVRLIDNTN
ncbi:DNA replication ATP-dependent helicase/nuclease DNA2 [Pseudomyrmex gracilis]|uniref:DNA replication ATP-dependent helicase/nuclease DNA2 n=1 Tax=Pseudomyrmex gracilis TaxID=219809 RepID=UPI000994E3ED|nr:DNA replication ATP-dependent helicase/nuclease DNA2 [Pseudomyrmex gracilis]